MPQHRPHRPRACMHKLADGRQARQERAKRRIKRISPKFVIFSWTLTRVRVSRCKKSANAYPRGFWALIRPKTCLNQRSLLIAAAGIGDFGSWIRLYPCLKAVLKNRTTMRTMMRKVKMTTMVDPRVTDIEMRGMRLELIYGADSCRNIDRIARAPACINWPTADKRDKKGQKGE